MKILIDMNLSPDWVSVFAKYSIDSLHWSNVGDPAAIDQIIMAWASTNGYIVFTHDLDFGILLATTQANAPSVIQVRTQDILPATLKDMVIQVLRQFESELDSGVLITIDPSRYRVRILPIITPKL
jgi:predicted nuclease of predicted toxin-antitoxin system